MKTSRRDLLKGSLGIAGGLLALNQKSFAMSEIFSGEGARPARQPSQKGKWGFRGVQMTLMVKPEPMMYIFDFIDFVSQYDYNYLVLYIEGMIKTKSFPYKSDEESYSPEQMKEVVAYAGKKGLEVIPVVGTQAHAKLFLEHAELAHLAELRGGTKGRFSDEVSEFCPSMEGTYEFFEKYFTELAEIFPCEYVHAGGDEAWDMGLCELCKKRVKGREGYKGILAKHFIDIHKIISGKLGKKMIIWDDMFEYFPNALEMLPRDIIMCCWLYDNNAVLAQGHFLNRVREDVLAKYDALGFKHMFAPRELSARNIETLTRYASGYNAMGGMLTIWGRFKLEYYPNVAFSGKLWADGNVENADYVFAECVNDIFGISDPVFVRAIKIVKSVSEWGEKLKAESFLRGPVSEHEYERVLLFGMLSDVLVPYGSKVSKPLGKEVFEGILNYLRCEKVQQDLRTTIPEVYRGGLKDRQRKAVLSNRLKGTISDIEKMEATRMKLWSKYLVKNPDGSLRPDGFEKKYVEFKKELSGLLTDPPETGLLTVRFMLPERYSCQWASFLVKYKGRKDWVKVVEKGVFKQDRDLSAFYYISFPVSNDLVPTAIKIDTWGYGGLGFAFLEITNKEGNFRPITVTNPKGLLRKPEYLLIDDKKWCFMGETNTRKSFWDPKLARDHHTLELVLAKAK